MRKLLLYIELFGYSTLAALAAKELFSKPSITQEVTEDITEPEPEPATESEPKPEPEPEDISA